MANGDGYTSSEVLWQAGRGSGGGGYAGRRGGAAADAAWRAAGRGEVRGGEAARWAAGSGAPALKAGPGRVRA